MLKNHYRINELTGINIHSGGDEGYVFAACCLKAEGNNLTFVKKISPMFSLEEMAKVFPKNQTIALNLTGKGVLTKRIETVQVISPAVFSSVIPNAKMEDFYIQNCISGKWSYLSIIRRSEADKWVAQLQQFNLGVLQLSLGPFTVQHILGQLNIYGEEILFNGHKITRNDLNELENVSYDPSEHSGYNIKVENEPLAEELILPYAAAFQLLLSDNLEPICADIPQLRVKLEEKLLSNKIRVNGLIFLVTLMILLVINIALLSSLTASNEKFALQQSSTTVFSNSVTALTEQVQRKEKMLDQVGWTAAANRSRYIDQIAQILPDEVIWKEISIDPIDVVTSRVSRKLMFSSRKIKVTGESKSIIPVNEWIARVKTNPWVKNVQLSNYSYNNELSTGQFIVMIDY